ncbi:hypothetical protein R0K05_23285, partial [Planococcus sp. SIMBA_160]
HAAHEAARAERAAARSEVEVSSRNLAMTSDLCHDLISLYSRTGRLPDLQSLPQLPPDADWQARFQREVLLSQALQGQLSVLY